MKNKRRVMAVSCSHGMHLNNAARAEVMRIRNEHKPHILFHLGDWMDATAFMRSASETERGQSIIDDCEAGIDFLRELRPTVLFNGNHDDRLWKDAKHVNAIRRDCARLVIDKIETFCGVINARLMPYTGAVDATGWLKTGPVIWGHGIMYNENAARDHAEAFATHGRYVVFGHTHRVMVQTGRTMSDTIGYSIGCLCDKPAMQYAKGRRATMAWQHAVLIGEITEDEAWLHVEQLGTSQPQAMPELTW
jgi:predicted phosphodiesterase|tara:strand:+ start:3345 stop:4091 length:747 start_codon:yes stop_codon:yes gene_type:complete